MTFAMKLLLFFLMLKVSVRAAVVHAGYRRGLIVRPRSKLLLRLVGDEIRRLSCGHPGFHVLCHLLTSDHLSETVIQLLLVEYIGLSSAHKNLADDARVVKNILNALASDDLSLSTVTLLASSLLL